MSKSEEYKNKVCDLYCTTFILILSLASKS